MSLKPTKTTKSTTCSASLFHGQSSSAIFQSLKEKSHDDIVAFTFHCNLEEGMSEEAALRVAMRQIDMFGGSSAYVNRRIGDGRSDRNAAIRRDHQRGESIALLCRRYQVSRVTVWRVLGLEAG
jgi:Mor family transcriptional regulator